MFSDDLLILLACLARAGSFQYSGPVSLLRIVNDGIEQRKRQWLKRLQGLKTRLSGGWTTLAPNAKKKRPPVFFESTDDVLWSFDFPSWKINYVSPSIEKIYGRSAREFYANQKLWLECIHPGDRQKVIGVSRKILESQSQTFQCRIDLPDGGMRWLHYEVQFISGDKPDGAYVNALGRDISEQMQLEESLRINKRALSAIYRCEAIIAASSDEYAMLKGVASVVTASGYQMAWVGILADDDSGRIIPFGLSDEHQSYLECIEPQLRSGGSGTTAISQALQTRCPAVVNYFGTELEMTPWRADAIRRGFRSKIALPLLIRNDELIGVLNVYATEGDAFNAEETKLLSGLAHRVSIAIQSYRHRSALQRLAYHDALTGLPNRTMLLERLEHSIAQADHHAYGIWVIFVDIDNFKFVNDTLGHLAGDYLLKNVAHRLQSVVRESDTVARFGGDEFVLVLPDRKEASVTRATDSVKRLMEAITEPLMIEGHKLYLTASMGVAVYPADGGNPDELVAHADIAMYRVKETGRNNFQFYTPSMNVRAMERLELEGDLRNALERDEFELHYQPQVDLRTGRIVGMEALIRWNHPKLGMVPPDRFIGLAEETGLIIPIGAWVLRTACAQNQAWQRAGLSDLDVAVNLSSRQFSQKELLTTISDVLAETGMAPHHLKLELTESVLMTDVERAIDIMHNLTELGVELALDDFGTGYSSLSYLKQFPIEVLKIDRSFIRDITTDTDAAAIVASIISLAHNLKLQVIAEGVETREQLIYLRHYRCELMQGYYFSPAVASSAFENMLKTNKTLSMETGKVTA